LLKILDNIFCIPKFGTTTNNIIFLTLLNTSP
jgi:hypothetical protein